MPSLRKRVSSYFRQLSFHNESRDKKHNINENTFVTKYLQGLITLNEGPPIIYGKNPTDLPNYELGCYENGSNTIIGCFSGPHGGLTTVKRTEKHLSLPDADIDFIDTHDEEIVSSELPKKSPHKILPGQPIDNTTMVIKVAGHEYCVTNKQKRHSKSHSLGSISDFNIEIEKTKIEKSFYCSNNNCETVECKNNPSVNHDIDSCNTPDYEQKEICQQTNENHEINRNGCSADDTVKVKKAVTKIDQNSKNNVEQAASHEKQMIVNKTNSKPRTSDTANRTNVQSRYGLSKSKSEGNPFHHKKRGRIIKIERPNIRGEEALDSFNIPKIEIEDSSLPHEWNKKSELIYGLSDSLYDRNQVTRNKNGDPIADCFGIISRKDSAILAVADGVNWGEKASIAAKSAVHGSLHYLNKTIFNDTKPFENLTIKTDESSLSSSMADENTNLISNTREVFVCLLRAFNCAHDLILENKGMLTTLTVAVVLPLKQKLERRVHSHAGGGERREFETQYVCCVCNVGDTLAYVYSQKYGVRELTKGSHDISSNRDMRDALGALGPVDGINPELSNLTLSITTLRRGDIVMVSSDGLTDNFDPNVCRFTVNCNVEPTKPKRSSTNKPTRNNPSHPSEDNKPQSFKPVKIIEHSQKPPIKPPRRSKNRDDSSRNSAEGSIKSATLSEKSSSASIESETMQVEDQKIDSKVQSDGNLSNLGNPNKLMEGSISNNQQGSSLSASDEKHSQEPSETNSKAQQGSSANKPEVDYGNPLVQQFIRENSVEDSPKVEKSTARKPTVVENKASSLRRQVSSQQRQEIPQSSQKPGKQATSTSSKTMQTIDDKNSASKRQDVGYKFLRSKTSLDIRSSNLKQILRNEDGIPYITPIQRYELQLLLMEDVLKHGISGKDSPCTSARKLCENLVSFTISITSAKRHTLEDQDLYFDNKNGVLVEVSSQEKKIRRKKGLERVQNLPGKLDHVTVAAYNVGNFAH